MGDPKTNQLLSEIEEELSKPVPEATPDMDDVQDFARLEMLRRQLEEALKRTNIKIDAIRPRAEEMMSMSGMSNCRVGDMTLYFREKFTVTKKANKDGVTTDDVCHALRLLGRSDMVNDGYNSSSLKAYVGELLEEMDEVPEPLRELINVRKWPHLVSRR